MEKYHASDDPIFKERAISIKEERSHMVKEHLWVLWTDYFKPPHFEKYPELHTLVNEATKLAGASGTIGAGGDVRAAAGGEPELDADGNPILRAEEDDEDDEATNMSLAAMEAALKPKVLETLDLIARDYGKLSEMQDLRMSATLRDAAN